MNYIPAIYFSILTIYLLMKRGIDASSYISLIYTATSIFAVGIDVMGLNPNLVSFASLLPTILYCLLLTLFIAPIVIVDINSYNGIYFQNKNYVRWVTYIFFVTFVGYTVAYFGDLKFVISYGDFAELKLNSYEGDGVQLTKYPAVIELFLFPIRVLANASVVMLFVFFFNITYLKEKWWINAMALIGSTTVIVVGILLIDRSSTFFWVLILGLAVSMFWNKMSTQIKSVAIGFSLILILVSASYAMSVTKDRFEDRDGGSGGGVVMYLGQPYYHFCEVWDYYPAPDGITTKTLFTAFHKYVLHDFENTVVYQAEMGLKSNMDLGVFYTHLGSFMLSAGKIGPFMITCVYLALFYFLFKEKEKIRTANKMEINCLSFEKLMVMFFLLCIPTVGCICYYYENFYIEIAVYALVISLFVVKDNEGQILTKIERE